MKLVLRMVRNSMLGKATLAYRLCMGEPNNRTDGVEMSTKKHKYLTILKVLPSTNGIPEIKKCI